MPRFTTTQQRFTKGELDPAMVAREDIDDYYGAVAVGTDILPIVQGGFKRRPGLEHIDRVQRIITLVSAGTISETAPNGGTAGNASDQNSATTVVTTTNISTVDPYVVIHYDLGSALDVGVLYLYDFSLSAGSSSEFYLQVSTDNAAWVTVGDALSVTTTAADFSRRVFGSYRYVRLARIGSTDLGTAKATISGLDVAEEGAISDTRCINFKFNVEQTYKMVVSDKNIAIYQGRTHLIDLYISSLTSARLNSIDWEQDADTLLIFQEDVQTITVQRNGSNTDWIVGSVTYSNIPTFDFGAGAEAIWSVTRGWPRHGAFYQGRLWVDGGKSLPSRVYGSNVDDFFNFSFGTGLADEAVGPLQSGFDDIESFYPGRNLAIFTNSDEYIIPQVLGESITPTNAYIRKQTSIGSEPGFRPREVEGGIMFVQREGASIQEFLFTETEQAYGSNFISILSSHLINSPVDFALRKATSTEDGAYLLIPLANGDLTIGNILRSENIVSFMRATTDGEFKRCGADVEDMFFVVERTIDGTANNYLERFNNDHTTDASTRYTTGLPTDTFAGLDHLEGETVKVIADGAMLADKTVASGSITTERDAESSLEVGLNYTPICTDLPATLQVGLQQSITGKKTNISKVYLRLSNTFDITVNGKPVSFRMFGPSGGGSPLDQPPTAFTGVKRLFGIRGWSEDAQITISQSNPLPMTVLSITKEINV